GPADGGPDRQPAVAHRRKVTGERAMTSPAVKVDAAASATPSQAPAGSEPAAGSDEVAARAWQAMRTLVLDRYDRRRKVTDALGMSFIRAKALRLVAAGPMTMRELAAGLGTHPPHPTGGGGGPG